VTAEYVPMVADPDQAIVAGGPSSTAEFAWIGLYRLMRARIMRARVRR
jgi:hypothetical protein